MNRGPDESSLGPPEPGGVALDCEDVRRLVDRVHAVGIR